MSNLRTPGPRTSTNSTQDGKKKRKPRDLSEQVGEIRNAALSALLEKKKVEADELRRKEEDEVALMTYGPSYKRTE
jgi:hypothetical protein